MNTYILIKKLILEYQFRFTHPFKCSHILLLSGVGKTYKNKGKLNL